MRSGGDHLDPRSNGTIRAEVAVNLGVLGEVGRLATQDRDFSGWIAKSGRWKRFAPGEFLYLVGDEPVTIHRAEPGFWIGEAAILANVSRMISLTAVSDCILFFYCEDRAFAAARPPSAPLESVLRPEQPEHDHDGHLAERGAGADTESASRPLAASGRGRSRRGSGQPGRAGPGDRNDAVERAVQACKPARKRARYGAAMAS